MKNEGLTPSHPFGPQRTVPIRFIRDFLRSQLPGRNIFLLFRG